MRDGLQQFAAFDFAPATSRISSIDRRRLEEDAVALLKRQTGVSRKQALKIIRDEMARRAASTLWRSPVYQVGVGDFEDEMATITVKRNDRETIGLRSHLVHIGMRFQTKGYVSGELYPASERVVDTANQYWIHALPLHFNGLDLGAAVQQTLFSDSVAHGFWKLLHLPLGPDRDWREVQHWKDEQLGPDVEAMDLLYPLTLEKGPVLLVAREPGYRFPVGFRSGMRCDDEVGGSRQRPGAREGARP